MFSSPVVTCWLLFMLTACGLAAQTAPPTGSGGMPPAGTVVPKLLTHDSWGVRVRHLASLNRADSERSEMELRKRRQTKVKALHRGKINPERVNAEVGEAPVAGPSFQGNPYNYFYPSDNHIAVSRAGSIVSVVNSSVMFTDVGGGEKTVHRFSDFFNHLETSGYYFDPRVIYDAAEDRFIMVVLNGNTPENSKIAIAFSSSSDPHSPWSTYLLEGDPKDSGTWADFPNIGLSDHELIVSFNQFDKDDSFQHSIVYQIQKSAGYKGGHMRWVYYTDPSDTYGNSLFNLVPVTAGFEPAGGREAQLLTSYSGWGNVLFLTTLSDTVGGEPRIRTTSITAPAYEIGGHAFQRGSESFMDIGDSRLRSTYRNGDTLHFVFTTECQGGYNCIYYGKLDLPTRTVSVGIFGEPGLDLAYPSIAPLAAGPDDNRALIVYLQSSPDHYPEFRAVGVAGDFQFSPSVLIKEGETSVGTSQDSVQRWGDYTGIARRPLDDRGEVWVSGSYGALINNPEDSVLATWIAMFSDREILLPPVARFASDAMTVNEGESIRYEDMTQEETTRRRWQFPGGQPATSQAARPEVNYSTAGNYAVRLTVENKAGRDSIYVADYVTVLPRVVRPVSSFTADRTVIEPGESVAFTDRSENEPTEYLWSFAGGIPATSSDPNPTVVYEEVGKYDVSLVVGNAAGYDTMTSQALISVDIMDNTFDPRISEADFTLFPNPARSGEDVTFTFNLTQARTLAVTVVDSQGKKVDDLVYYRAKAGKNGLQFNNARLRPGIYQIILHDATNQYTLRGRMVVQ